MNIPPGELVRYYVVQRAGRNRGIYAAFGAWESRITQHHGWGDAIATRRMTPEEHAGYSRNFRLTYEKYQSIDGLLDDERRVLAGDPAEFVRLRDALTSSPAIKQFAALVVPSVP